MVEEKITRGSIYLAKLNPSKKSEVGKVRPITVLNSQIVLNSEPPIIFVCPLSSKSHKAFEGLHVRILARYGLDVDSYALVEHCRSISTSRLILPKISQITDIEISTIIQRLQHLLGV